MSYRQRPGDQPLPCPVPGAISSHQWVINDLAMDGSMPPGLFEAVRARIKAREELGISRYGQLLQPGNGRDVMRDVWEETVDQVAYLATAYREGAPVLNFYNRALDFMLDLVSFMDGIPRS